MRTKLILTALLLVAATAGAVEPRREDAYQSIIDRNPFGLKDPPPPPVEKEKPPGPPEKKTEFYLTGISTIGFPKQPKKAYLINKDQTKKEYSEKYFNMVIGDRSGDLALQDIDEKNRRVKIAYRGEEMWLNMKDNGVPAPTGPGMPGMPGMVGHPGPLVQPGAMPMPMNNNAGSPAPQPVNNINRRIPRTSMGAPVAAPAPVIEGPQTDAEVLEQIIRMQNPGAFPQPSVNQPGVNQPGIGQPGVNPPGTTIPPNIPGTPPPFNPRPGGTPAPGNLDTPPLPPLPF